MKFTNIAIIALAIISVFTSCGKREQYDADINSIRQEFKSPDSEYGTIPFMVWNGKVTESEIDRMLNELKIAGCGGTIIHPRPGMITEYLSEDWENLVKHTVEKGKELDMNIWIYDENSYPSGFAGGHVPAQMPESYNQGAGLALTKTDLLPEKMDDYFIYIAKEDGKFATFLPNDAAYKNKPGDYYLYNKTYYSSTPWYGGYCYTDVLVNGVTEKFIDVTMKGYEDKVGAEFGKQVKGVFTDEPNIGEHNGLRWTPDLFEEFEKQWGYDLKANLVSLTDEVGDWKKIRHDYIETLLQMFIDRWAKPWKNYCDVNNLNWTGHYWEHGWPDMRQGGDNMAMYAWHHTPGIDLLFNQFNESSPQAQFGNVRSVKELRSVANQMGYKRTLCETYGGGGWDETFKDFKRLGDWAYVLGVNLMNQHLSHMTLQGARKYDYPPVFSYHSPWWDDYSTLNNYYKRLSLVLTKGEQVNDILVLEPTTSLWCYYSYYGSNPRIHDIANTFQSFITTLEKKQVEYDLGSENIIKDHGSVKGGKFIIGKRAYSKVVLPPLLENLNAPTLKLLKEFVAQGGNLISFSSPTLLDGNEDTEMKEFGNSDKITQYTELNETAYQKSLNNKNLNIEGKGGNLFHQRRYYNGGELIFLVNSSMNETTNCKLSMSGKALLQLDPFSGDIYSYPCKVNDNALTAEFDIEPAGSILLYSSYSDEKGQEYILFEKDEIVACDSKTSVKPLKDNAINVDFCDLYVNGKKFENIHFASAAAKAFNEHGFANGNPWNCAVQYKSDILDRDTFSTGGFKVEYKFLIKENFDYTSLKAVIERPSVWNVEINNKKITPVEGEWRIDKDFAVYNIGNDIKKGENVISLSVAPMNIMAEIEPIYIMGDFSVAPADKGWFISKPNGLEFGSWKSQGYPFYSWNVAYSKEYKIRDLNKNYFVRLNKWAGTVAEIYVNNEKAGIIYSDPYTLDITSSLKEGNNNVEVRVIGSLKNLLGPHYKNPAPGLASPWHWQNVNEDIPGQEYQMCEYGLMEDFDLISKSAK